MEAPALHTLRLIARQPWRHCVTSLRSAHWLASSVKLAARCPVSGCSPSCNRNNRKIQVKMAGLLSELDHQIRTLLSVQVLRGFTYTARLLYNSELAATLRWFTAGCAIRIALRQLSQKWKLRHYDVITRKLSEIEKNGDHLAP